MNDDKKAQVDSETILMTLDQIGQTIDIMTNVVGRLRGYITEQLEASETAIDTDADTDRVATHTVQSQTLH